MGKRSCPFNDDIQSVKKRINEGNGNPQIKNIKSELSEKTLQLLFKGAAKQFDANESESFNINNCYVCSVPSTTLSCCSYCCKKLCEECLNNCKECNEDFCKHCSFFIYELNQSVCYSCYK